MKKQILALTLGLVASNALANEAGLQITQLPLPNHDERVRVAIWYPTDEPVNTVVYGDNPVFHGVEANMYAPIAQGQFPIILFSHGMGGTDRSQAWIGSEMAKRGAITISVNHPNTTWGSFDMKEGIKHWTRAQDLSHTLDWVLNGSDFAASADQSRIMASGFSYGGWTALSLGGVTGNHAGIVAECAERPTELVMCEEFLSDKILLQNIDPGTWNESYSDARVTHVMAIDPGFVWGLEDENVQSLSISPMLVRLGRDNDALMATDFVKSGFTDLLDDPRIKVIEPAIHFTVMPMCRPEGAAILIKENDDPVCTDPQGANRAEVHETIIGLMASELDL